MNDLPVVGFAGIPFSDPRAAENIALFGTGGDDTILGSGASEFIRGGAGRDTIRAGGGDDFMDFSAGDNVAGETYDEGAGRDELEFGSFASLTLNLSDNTLASIEILDFVYGSRGAIDIVQFRSAQIGPGLASNATIIGTAGGAANASDQLHIAMDTANLDLSRLVIRNFSDVDFVNIKGRGTAETIIGSSVAERIDGGTGADKLDGGAGVDTLSGGSGDDTFYVDTASDNVIETLDGVGGFDTVWVATNYTLAAGQGVDLLRAATGTTGRLLTGNEISQQVYGSNGADGLKGKGGNDSFYFDTALNAAANVDRILDFGPASGDADPIRLDTAVFTTLGLSQR